MKQKIVGIVAACACVFMFVAGGVGFWEIQKEAKDKQAEKEATLEQLDTLKAGVTKLEENRPAYEEGLKAYETGLAQYEAGKAEYEKGKQDLAAGKQEYEAGKKTLAAGKAEYAKGKQDLAAGKAEYAKGQQDLAAGKAEYAKGQQDYETGLATYNAAIANKDALIQQQTAAQMGTPEVQALVAQNMPAGVKLAALKAMGFSDEQIAQISAGQMTLNAAQQAALPGTINAIQSNPTTMAQVKAAVTEKVQAGVQEKVTAAVDEKIASSKQELDAGKAKLDAAAVTIAAGEKKLAAAEKEITTGEKKLAAAEKEIAAGEKKLADAETEIAAGEKKLADAEVQLADAEVQLADGKAQLEVFEEGQAQVDAGYATVLKNEKIAAKVDGGMEILDAAYEVVDEETVATTDRLMGRATYLGIAMAAALIVLIGVAVVWFNKRAVVIAAIALVAAIVANVHGLTRTYHEHELQMAAMLVLAVMAAIFTGVCAMKKKEIETA